MKGERKRCLDFEQLLATRSFRLIRHFGRVGTGWKWLQSISIHLTYPFHAHAVFPTIKIHKGYDEMKCFFGVGCCTLLAICLLVPFVSGQSFKRRSNGRSLFLARPGHMLCVDPWRSKWPLVLCCQAIIIYHVLIWLSFLLLTIQGNLQLLPFIPLKIDPSRNISSISRHSPCKKPCYSLIGNIYPAEL